ncbi:MAG: hypothetical protein FWH28_00525, partial [Clostridiales bacterium]|nr:hypothetical protein [Clostridiales bacterium]
MTRKILAVFVLAAMILTGMPMTAWAGGVQTGTNTEINVYGSVIEGPDRPVLVQPIGNLDGNGDGAEFNLTIISQSGFAAGDEIYVASRRCLVDYFYYWDGQGNWIPFGNAPGDTIGNPGEMQQTDSTYALQITYGDMLRPVGSSETVATARIKVVSVAAGVSQIVFGRDAADTATYAGGVIPFDGLSQIIGQRSYPAEYAASLGGGVQTGTNPKVNVYGSVVEGPDSAAPVQFIYSLDGNGDGEEFDLAILSESGFAAGDEIYVASSRYAVDYFFYQDAQGRWIPFGNAPGDEILHLSKMQQANNSHALQITYGDMLRPVDGSDTVATARIKVVSVAAGTSQIVFGADAADTASYAMGVTPIDGLIRIIGVRRYPAEYTFSLGGVQTGTNT